MSWGCQPNPGIYAAPIEPTKILETVTKTEVALDSQEIENSVTETAAPSPSATVVSRVSEETVITELVGKEITPEPENTVVPSATALESTPTEISATSTKVVSTPQPQLAPEDWREWPILPVLSAEMEEIYQKGIRSGNNPKAFATVGDCQSVPIVFMGVYDLREEYWPEMDHSELLSTIQYFQGSFGRRGQATQNGLSVASALSPFWANPEFCDKGESPVVCDLRIQNPSFVFVNLGTNFGDVERHKEYLEEIVQVILAHNAIPILSSKGDNAEGDHRINQIIAEVANEYRVPFWNFWRVIQPLYNFGLDDARPEGNYLTREAWEYRSYTGLQVLHSMLQIVEPGVVDQN